MPCRSTFNHCFPLRNCKILRLGGITPYPYLQVSSLLGVWRCTIPQRYDPGYATVYISLLRYLIAFLPSLTTNVLTSQQDIPYNTDTLHVNCWLSMPYPTIGTLNPHVGNQAICLIESCTSVFHEPVVNSVI